jgi:anti-anti-sigma factor
LAGGAKVDAALGNEPEQADFVPLGLTHRIYPDGRAVVVVGGELDAATADQASDYVRQIIDRVSGPVTVDLGGVSFCDARGLRALVQIAAHSRTTGRRVRLTAVRPAVLKIMRITGVDLSFPELGSRPSRTLRHAAYSGLWSLARSAVGRCDRSLSTEGTADVSGWDCRARRAGCGRHRRPAGGGGVHRGTLRTGLSRSRCPGGGRAGNGVLLRR